ncbi:DEAD/DEAH box helicase [Rhodoplanes roseus]|uniref:DEAD-box ATP-dependent RNA helicase RhpA n=1 Tax=Rhodoplanes roseus TaxID=29409 RepID=A0A327L3A8_9BRAD|nr:DEAD/DEAH box helicase [Rhodoplanes roseus]RAI44946.1 DEAD/DEAH box helicase [Rhodoplanes roseus]
MSFANLGLSEKVLAAVESAGYTAPTPIQEQAIPHVLARRDVLGIAQTGTGKTAAFVLPMLTKLEQGRARARMPRTLILEPTRELAAQVEESFIKYGKNHKLNVALLIGGVSFGNQDTKLTRGVDVLIATPGRLLDHTERGGLLLTGVELLVIDEADRMLDMGFIPDIERICKLVPFTRQTLFFTATMPAEIRRITEQFLHNPVKVEVSRPATTVEAITQGLVKCGREPHDKREVLRRLIRQAEGLKNAIVFCNRKRDVATLHRSLQRHKFSAVALHGDMDQSARTAALDQFRKGEIAILVASDVAARGLDIPDVSHVFNFDVPHHPDDYVHRIGRTGRAGRTGTALTIVTSPDQKAVAAIEKLIGRSIAWVGAPPADDVAEDDGPREPVRMGARMPRRSRDGQGREREAPQGREDRGREDRGRDGRGRQAQARDGQSREAQGRDSQPRDNQPRDNQASDAPVRGERPSRPSQPERSGKPAHEAPRSKRPATVTPLEAARRRQPRDEAPDDIENYLPAFLLRPVRIKA